jgi:hypothetical protein
MDALKPKQLRVYLDSKTHSGAARLSEACGLSEPQLVSMLLRAAVEAVLENGGRFSLPLKMEVSRDEPS